MTLSTIALIGMLTGCGAQNPKGTRIIYNERPDDFILRIDKGIEYEIVKPEASFSFKISTRKGLLDNDRLKIAWGDNNYEDKYLRASERIPYLVRCNGKDWLWLYNEFEKGDTPGELGIFDLNQESWIGKKEEQFFSFSGEVEDPRGFKIRKRISLIGNALTEVEAHVTDEGRIEEVEPALFYYCVPELAVLPLTLNQDIEAEVLKDEADTAGVMRLFEKGTVFYRYRCDNSYKGWSDLKTTDGETVRFHEHYLFSEPDAYLEINGESGIHLFDGVRYYPTSIQLNSATFDGKTAKTREQRLSSAERGEPIR